MTPVKVPLASIVATALAPFPKPAMSTIGGAMKPDPLKVMPARLTPLPHGLRSDWAMVMA